MMITVPGSFPQAGLQLFPWPLPPLFPLQVVVVVGEVVVVVGDVVVVVVGEDVVVDDCVVVVAPSILDVVVEEIAEAGTDDVVLPVAGTAGGSPAVGEEEGTGAT